MLNLSNFSQHFSKLQFQNFGNDENIKERVISRLIYVGGTAQAGKFPEHFMAIFNKTATLVISM